MLKGVWKCPSIKKEIIRDISRALKCCQTFHSGEYCLHAMTKTTYEKLVFLLIKVGHYDYIVPLKVYPASRGYIFARQLIPQKCSLNLLACGVLKVSLSFLKCSLTYMTLFLSLLLTWPFKP